MVSVVYPKYKEAAISGGANTNLSTGNVKLVCVDAADYTYSAAHEFLSDIPVAARVGTSPNLTSKTTTDGTFDAANPTITGVTGDQFEAVVAYVDTGVEGTSRLVSYTDSGTGLPFTPNSGDITIQINALGLWSL